jgi:hypothetical protein
MANKKKPARAANRRGTAKKPQASAKFEADAYLGGLSMRDSKGERVSLQKAAEAVKAFAELWPVGDFDCGPQEYDCMVKELMQEIPAAAQKVAKAQDRQVPSLRRTDSFGCGGGIRESAYREKRMRALPDRILDCG